MNVCFVVNKNYIGQLKVCLKSLFETQKDVDVYVLEAELDSDNQNDLKRFANEFNREIYFKKVDYKIFKELPVLGTDLFYTTYYKLMIPYLLQDLKKVLYLDCDLLITKDLSPLYDKNTNHFISAVLDEKVNKKRKNHIKLITGDENNIYFNAGAMLFDFAHADEIVDKDLLFDFIKNNSNILKFHDQDIFNHFYIKKCDIVGEEYNYTTTYKSIKDFFFKIGGKKAVVIHYANWKPWNSNYIGKYYKKYYKMYKSLEKKEKLNYLKKRNIFSMLKLCFKYLKR